MLKNIEPETDLLYERNKLNNVLSEDLRQYLSTDDNITNIRYPVFNYPNKVKSLGFDKQNIIEGTLTGIRGQNLYFDNELVLNIRKHNGYLITFSHD